MNKRQVVLEALKFRPVPYVPWAWSPTQQCAERLRDHLQTDDLSSFIGSHFLDFFSGLTHFEAISENHVCDVYGVSWDRTVDKDIGTPSDWPIKRPEDFANYEFPDALSDAWYDGLVQLVEGHPDLFRRYNLGFSLYERAWTMRGMTNFLMDMVERPEFAEELLDAIVEHNLVQIRRALACGVDAVNFGDDYGMQTGLIFGIDKWRHFFKPRLARMFAPVREAGKYVCMHSCGRVNELFDDLVEIGLNVFNPFQPEVMDVFGLMGQYHGRLAFHGGMSIQKTLPFGTPGEVRELTQELLGAGANGGYIFSPSHAVPSDVPPENLAAMMDVLTSQAGLRC